LSYRNLFIYQCKLASVLLINFWSSHR